jgi:hypothetical protein
MLRPARQEQSCRAAHFSFSAEGIVHGAPAPISRGERFFRKESVVPLSEFQVIHERGGGGPSFGDPLIRCIDGDQVVLAFVSRTGLDDYFRVPGGERRTLKQWNLVTQSNQDALTKIIADKYERGVRTTYQDVTGQTFPRVDVTLADMERCGEKLRDDVLKIQASFQ